MKRKLFLNCRHYGPSETTGEKINLRKGLELFITRNPYTECWAITELQSGMSIAEPGDTKKEAIEAARKRLAELSDDQIRRGIEAAIKEFGILNPPAEEA